jgi:hypothetical protein
MARDQIRPIKVAQPLLFPALRSNSYTVSGLLTPDVTGVLIEDGLYDGVMSYSIVDTSFFIWRYVNLGTPAYYISKAKGDFFDDTWRNTTGNLLGEYAAYAGDATGTATLAVSSTPYYYTVSGTLNPDVTGDYFKISTDGVGPIVHQKPGTEDYLMDLSGSAQLYRETGGSVIYWEKLTEGLAGTYNPDLASGATGTATVTAVGETKLLLQAPGANRSIQITSLELNSETTQSITLTDGTTAIFGPIYLTENVPVTLNFPHTVQVGDNKPLHAIIPSTGATAIQVWGYIDS